MARGGVDDDPEKRKKGGLLFVAVFLLGVFVSLFILDAPFTGQDELLVLDRAQQANRALGAGDVHTLAKVFLRDYHPPARTLIAMPFVWLWGPVGAALRLPNCILWGLVCACAAVLGLRLNGIGTGLATGLLLAGSGLFDLFGMAHGHAGEALFVTGLLLLWAGGRPWEIHTPAGRRACVGGGVLLISGFLFFTSILPIAILYHSAYGMVALRPTPDRRTTLVSYAKISAPFAAFYLLYYLCFLGLPALSPEVPYGQWLQNLQRASTAGLNIHALNENIRALNWYVLPWVPIPILLLGMWGMWRRCRAGFWITLPFGFLFCFYLRGMTGAHFFSYFCWVLPFAAAQIKDLWGPNWRVGGILFWIALIALTGAWNYIGHIRSYTPEQYPAQWVRWSQGQVYWRNNQVADDVFGKEPPATKQP